MTWDTAIVVRTKANSMETKQLIITVTRRLWCCGTLRFSFKKKPGPATLLIRMIIIDSEQEKPGLMIATKLKIKDCLKIKNCCPNCPSTFLFSSKLSVHIRRTCCTNDRRSSVSILNCRCSINSNTIVLRHLWMWYQRLQARGRVGNDIADWHYDLLNVQNCGILHIFNFIDQISGSFSMEGLPQNGKSVCFTTTKLSLLDPGPSCKSLALFFNHKVREVCWGRFLCQFFATVA